MCVNKFKENVSKCAENALKKPEDFGYWGPEDTFKTWGFCGIDKHRDSETIDISNFRVISSDLINQYPEDFRVETYRHWAVGSVDRLLCRILKDKDFGVVEGNITDAFKAAMVWQDKLQEYPIADENDWAELESLEGDYEQD
jgi:hypothetical protein